MAQIIIRFCDIYLKHYIISSIIALVIFIAGLVLALQLKINSNQLDMLPDTIPQVSEAHRITKMVGGTGFFIITLHHGESSEGDKLIEKATRYRLAKRDDETRDLIKKANVIFKKNFKYNNQQAEILKRASDILYEKIHKLPEVRRMTYKLDLDFVKTHVLYRLETSDLKEAFRRLSIKRDELIRKADPFYIELEDDNYRLDLADIISKYSRIGKKEVVDEYYVSPDRRMMIILIKPSFNELEIEKCKQFIQTIEKIVQDDPALKKMGLKVGFSGSYMQILDAYQSIDASLKPTTFLSLAGIALILILFIRRYRLITAMMTSLIYAIVLTFGISYLVVGQLNMVTSIMAGLLAGLGIDFGIHFIYRFREEFSKGNDLHDAIKQSIIHTGKAAAWSAATTTAAFMALMLSDFGGFSEFGLIATYGIIIMALSMFFLIPLQIVIFAKLSPKFLASLKKVDLNRAKEAPPMRIDLPFIARCILVVIVLILLPSIWFAKNIQFDLDARNLIESDLTSELLQVEINMRYDITGSPLAVATYNLEDTAALFEHFDPMNEQQKEYISQVVSIYSFIPPRKQQNHNYQLMKNFRKNTSVIKKSMVPEAYHKHYFNYQKIIGAKPFGINNLPDYMIAKFKNVPESPVKGWLTFIYPKIDKIYNANHIWKLQDLVGEIRFPLIGNRTVRILADYAPVWRKKTGNKIKIQGSRKPENVSGLNIELSEYEINGLLDLVNNIDEAELNKLNLMPNAHEIILKDRPFQSINDLIQKKHTAVTTGSTLLMGYLSSMVIDQAAMIIITTIVVVCSLLFLSFRRPGFVLIALLPLLTGLIVMLAFMAIFTIKINFFNIVVFPVIIGYGINNSIFIFHRFLETGSLSRSVFHTSSAVVASSLTTLAGWGALSVAQHPGLQSIGFVACIGLSMMLFISITLLPAVLASLPARFFTKSK